jgi:2-polyprenyl-3-methyl-5-hydroxy-6-metoxy-1,4-benzoquinol methylase
MDAAYRQQYETFEQRHWWFVARRQIILQAIRRHAPPNPRWLDVGCGSGVLLAAERRIAEKVGVDLDPLNVADAREKDLDVRQVERGWDFAELGTFDLITLCDVIEHVEDERPAIEAVYNALRPGGVVLVTVPALMGLWGPHDVVNHHYRRYTRRTLARLFDGHRWQTRQSTYFSSVLLPMIWTARKLKNLRGRDTGHDLRFGRPVVDATLLNLFRLEVPLLRFGATLPLGSSLLLVCRKRGARER